MILPAVIAACASSSDHAATRTGSDASDATPARPSDASADGPSDASAERRTGDSAVRDGHDLDVETSLDTLPPDCTALAHCCLIAPSDDGDPTTCYEQATSGTLSEEQCKALLATYAAMGMCLADGGS